MNYTELQANVIAYLHRTDLASQCPTFISLAEAYLFREINVKALQVSAVGTITSGYGTLPADFGAVSKVMVTSNNVTYALDYLSQPYIGSFTTSAPTNYSLENDKIKIYGAADGLQYTLFYSPLLQNLSVSVTTNWLLQNAPDLYLYASALYGAKHVRNAQVEATLTAMLPALIDSVQRFNSRLGYPLTGSLQIKPRRY